MVTGLNYKEAAKILKEANGHVKSALVMTLTGVTFKEAVNKLEKADGFVRQALEI